MAAQRVVVILDQQFGERLRDIWPGPPVWIELSAANKPIVRELQTTFPNHDQFSGISGIDFYSEVQAKFLAELDTIDLHHGPYSTASPYTDLEVIGCPLTEQIRRALVALGFARFDVSDSGFFAFRSQDEAAVRRRK